MSEMGHVRKQKMDPPSTKSSRGNHSMFTVGGSCRHVPSVSVDERRSSWAAHRAGKQSACRNVQRSCNGSPKRQSSSAGKSLACSTARSATSKRRSGIVQTKRVQGVEIKRHFQNQLYSSRQVFQVAMNLTQNKTSILHAGEWNMYKMIVGWGLLGRTLLGCLSRRLGL